MAEVMTSQQVLALAPDAGSAKSGRELANVRKWQALGRSDRAIWGLCQGSGSQPYKVKIDLSDTTTNCSCPSRKFPCKHGLGLLLILADQAQAFTATEPPDWVRDWLDGRSKRAEVKAEKQAKAKVEEDAVDPAVLAKKQAEAAKRQTERQNKVADGLQSLDLWLNDLVRQGFSAPAGASYDAWEKMAKSLVDAQAPGAARLVRDLAGIRFTENWQDRLLEKLSRLSLLVQGGARLETLPEATQSDIRTAIGFSVRKEDLHADAPVVRDMWTVLGQSLEIEDNLRTQRTWLWGRAAQRPALVLGFAYGRAPLDASLIVGTVIDAELVFYPSAAPLRAEVKRRDGLPQPRTIGHGVDPAEALGYAGIRPAILAYAEALSANPWLERTVFPLAAVVPVRTLSSGETAMPGKTADDGNADNEETETDVDNDGEATSGSGPGQWYVRDAENHVLPIARRFSQGHLLAALSGGLPLEVIGEWDGEAFLPLAAYAQGALHVLSSNQAPA